MPSTSRPRRRSLRERNQGLPENYDHDVLQPFMESSALEVTRALQFFFTSTSYNQVDQIVLAGGCALLPGLDELVAKRAGVRDARRQSVSPPCRRPIASGPGSSPRRRRC